MIRFLILSFVICLTVACTMIPDNNNYTDLNGRQVDIFWGQKVYARSCAHCHDSGKNGAQIIGDSEGWSSRIEQGLDVLVKHAIEGYSGALGYMPPRGGNPALSHEDVTAATAYIAHSSIGK